MKTLYFKSHTDGKVWSSTHTNNKTTCIVNEFRDECYINFLMNSTKNIRSIYFNKCQNQINKYSIRVILDAAGFTDKYADNGVELNKILLSNDRDIRLLSHMAENDKNIDRYLDWVIGNFLALFNFHFGELILIESYKDDMDFPPKGFKPIRFKADKRVFYSKHDQIITKRICDDYNIKFNKGGGASLYPTALLIACSQLVLQGADFITDLAKF